MPYSFSTAIGSTNINAEIVFEHIDVDLVDTDTLYCTFQEPHIDVVMEDVILDVILENPPTSIGGDGGISTGGKANEVVREFSFVSGTLTGGDLVFPATIAHEVEKVENNQTLIPAMGIAYGFPASTTVEVLMEGMITLPGAVLVAGQKIFVSPTGEVTNTPPTEGYLQAVGYSLSETQIWFKADLQRTKRRSP